jgi:hypothetical protein
MLLRVESALLSCANSIFILFLWLQIFELSGGAGVQPLGAGEPNGIVNFFTNLFFVIANFSKHYT